MSISCIMMRSASPRSASGLPLLRYACSAATSSPVGAHCEGVKNEGLSAITGKRVERVEEAFHLSHTGK